ncbi:MAG: TetR/AcrR family transcriptional regulator [Caldilineaceae bacterium]|nr:TetR/AcrR family transcriptional regulator [Caldilineaceae bacterium]
MILPQVDSEERAENRIDPRVKRTRKLLLDAFLVLLAEKRYEEITIQDIATRATVNRATFYAHYVDKCALVDDFIRETFAQTLCRHQSTSTDTIDSTREYLHSLFLAVTDHWTRTNAECPQDYQMFESLAEAQIKMQLRDNVHAWLRAHTRYGTQDHQRLELAATIVSCSVYGAGKHWIQSAGKQPLEVFANEALPFIAATIAALDTQTAVS